MGILTPIQTLVTDIIEDFKHFSFRSERGILSLKTILSCLIALMIAWEINITDPTWAAWTAFVMMQSSRGSTLMQVVERIVSTVICLFAGILLLCFFGDNFLLLMIFSIIGLTGCFYFLAKSKSPFVWMYGPLTFLLVLFQTIGYQTQQITSVAYDRGLEVIIGVCCGMVVTLLFRTPATREELKKNNIDLLKKLSVLQGDCIQRYLHNTIKPEFQAELTALQNLTETQTQLRRFVRQENLFNTSEKMNHRLLEQVVFMSQEIISDLYWRHDNAAAELISAFEQPLTHLQKTIHASLKVMIAFVSSDGAERAAFQDQLEKWQQALNKLMDEAARFRDQEGAHFAVEASTQWAYFLVRQEAFFLLMDRFGQQADLPAPEIPRRESLRHRFTFDRYYWEYAIKTSLMAVLFPYFAMVLDLPGVTIFAVVVVVTLQFDLSVTKRNLFLLTVGAVMGVGFGLLLIACNFTSGLAYLCGIAVIGYFLAYAKHGPPSYSFAGWLAAYMFFSSTTGSLGPITDWRPEIVGLFEIGLAAFMMWVVLIWIWPFKDAKILQHYRAQLAWYQGLIQQAIANQNGPLVYMELNLLRQQIKALDGFHWMTPEFAKENQELVATWFRCYHTWGALSLAMESVDLSELDAPIRGFVEVVLSLRESTSLSKVKAFHDEIAAYSQATIEAFIKRKGLSFVKGIRIIHLLMVLEALTEYRLTLMRSSAA